MSVIPDFARVSYEGLLAMLRTQLVPNIREYVVAELRSRDRALANQWAEVCGGEFK